MEASDTGNFYKFLDPNVFSMVFSHRLMLEGIFGLLHVSLHVLATSLGV